MKQFLTLLLLGYCSLSFAASAEEEWNGSSLSDGLIQKIQTANYEYRKCTQEEMQKPAYATLDVRKATEEVIKQCEPVLGKMRTVYLTEKVPATIADRHLKKLRIQTTRNLLAELMFRDASRKAGQ